MAASRYWRITSLRPAVVDGPLSLSEIELRDGTNTRVDLAAALTCVVLPTAGSLSDLQDSSLDDAVTWSAQSMLHPRFALRWEFPVATDVVRLMIFGPDRMAFLGEFALQQSSDGISWTDPVIIPFQCTYVDASTPCVCDVVSDGSSYSSKVVQFGPLGYWPLNETSGTVANDISGNARHGSLVSSPILAAAPVRVGTPVSMGFNISGTGSQKVLVPTTGVGSIFARLDQPGSSFTIALWFRRTASSTYNFLVASWSSHYAGEANFRLAGTYFNAPENANVIGFGLWPTTASFLVVRKDAQRRRYQYSINGGAWLTSATFTGTNGRNGLQGLEFPAAALYTYYGACGYMSDMSIFGRALSDQEVLSLHQLGIGGVQVSDGLYPPVLNSKILIPEIDIFGEPYDDTTLKFLSPPALSLDREFGGTGKIWGTTKIKGLLTNTPTKARVVLLHQRSKLVVRETWSHPTTGYFAFDGVDLAQQFITLAEDSAGSFRPVAANRLVPKVA